MPKLTRSRLALAAILAVVLGACGQGDKTDAGALSGKALPTVAAPAGKAWSDVVTKTPEGGYMMGNPNAPIKLVEYGSLTCPHCKEFAETAMAEIRDKFVASGRVSFEFRNFVRDAIDLTAAQLVRCGQPEGFFALTDQVFAGQQEIVTKAQAAGQPAFEAAMKQPDAKRGVAIRELTGLIDFFAARGIARDQAVQCLANSAAASQLAKQTQDQSTQFEIQGTPTFLINGTKFDDNSWPKLKARLEELGAR